MEVPLIRYFSINKRWFPVYIIIAVLIFLPVVSAQNCFADVFDDSKPKTGGGLIRISPESRYDDPFDGISFHTVYKSGLDVCTNLGGQPVISLFTSPTCAHCEWVSEIYDTVVRRYMEEGAIEAHHYNLHTKDDLLTEEVETEIPEEILDLYHRGSPKDLVPYFNFSCKYERVSNGYETTKDTEAEANELMEVIETLIRVLSEQNPSE